MSVFKIEARVTEIRSEVQCSDSEPALLRIMEFSRRGTSMDYNVADRGPRECRCSRSKRVSPKSDRRFNAPTASLLCCGSWNSADVARAWITMLLTEAPGNVGVQDRSACHRNHETRAKPRAGHTASNPS